MALAAGAGVSDVVSVSLATIACSPVSLDWRSGGGEHDGEPSANVGGGSRKARLLSEGDGGLQTRFLA